MLVNTTKGPVDYDRLVIHDILTFGENSREIATEYYLDGELVRRSVHVEFLMPLEMGVQQGGQ